MSPHIRGPAIAVRGVLEMLLKIKTARIVFRLKRSYSRDGLSRPSPADSSDTTLFAAQPGAGRVQKRLGALASANTVCL
jgi:hypothetical protein